ncbi:Origin recognition complex subunit 1 [Holothuria leucospilota]|uniref:Origin recognition complex subunit 1 n=1 Tax=Holothuria leucospilota TaxID=206669 RepID=A0A9Q1HC49_HOLLE|nr:Origin recognition complex subunit 1 [Holothuria leucospilota]
MEGTYKWKGKFVIDGGSKRRSKKRYKQLQLPDGTVVKAGDTVLIYNLDGGDFVAEVIEFYDNGSELDSKRAIVQWYLRESELPGLGQLHLPSGGRKRELFLFDRPKSSLIAIDIDAETISGKCVVEKLHTDDEIMLSDSLGGLAYYFVCWAFNGRDYRTVFPDDVANAKGNIDGKSKKETHEESEDKQHIPEDSKEVTTVKTPFKRKMVDKTTLSKSVPQQKVKKKIPDSSQRLNMDEDGALDLFFSSEDEFTPKSKSKPNSAVLKGRSRQSMRTNLNFREDDICELDLDMTIYDVVKGRNKSEKVLNGITRKVDSQRKSESKVCKTPNTASKVMQKRGEETPSRRQSTRVAVPQSCPPISKSKSAISTKKEASMRQRNRKLVFDKNESNQSSSEDEENTTKLSKKQSRKAQTKRTTVSKAAPKATRKIRIDTPKRQPMRRRVPRSCPRIGSTKTFRESSQSSRKSIIFTEIKEEDEEWQKSESSSSDEDQDEEDRFVPVRRRTSKLPAKSKPPSIPNRKFTPKAATPQIHARKTPRRTPSQPLEQARVRLHVSAVPSSLPCRENEYADIFSFVKGHLIDKLWGCLYISGVPGTGKTATVHAMLEELNMEVEEGMLPAFQMIEINGMRLTDPHQAFVQILKHLTGQKATPQHAAHLLEQYFSSSKQKSKPVVLIVDELDLLWTRKQDVLYSIFDWPTKTKSGLIVVAIANTMDLPERIMMNRVSSRLGLSRMTFQPYTFKQLQEIVEVRLQGLRAFDSEAIQLAARKVAALSGDARRALDICRRATEIAEATEKRGSKGTVGLRHVEMAVEEMFCSPKIMAIRNASNQEQTFLRAVVSEFRQTGLEETTFEEVLKQHVSLCRLQGFTPPTVSEIWSVCVRLSVSKLLLLEAGFNEIGKRILLNVSQDDVRFALSQQES